MRVKFLFSILILLVSFSSFAQLFTLSGKITDDKKSTLPFAAILVKGSGTGTNSNADGYYTLKLAPGTYEIIFQYVGYRKEIRKVEISADAKLDIIMQSEAYELKEVVYKAGEDPAYEVIRQAIKKRKYYLNLVNSYTCKAYIKGLQRLRDIPKNFGKLLNVTAGDGDKLDSSMLGVIYLSESESKYHFRKPNDEKEIMYSSKVSGDNKAFSFNQLSDMKFNFYENLVYIDALSDRPFISPINENAFLSYRYHLLGTIFEDGKMINKIEVLPKRKTDPCFHGIIYIQENTWRIHSADMFLTKDAKIDFVDTLKIRQLHAPVKDSIWMPIGMNFGFYFKFLGFKGDGYYNAVISDYEINPTFPKRFFKNEILKVEEEANKKDTGYWKENRPIPLTTEEIDDYHKKDSIAKRRGTKEYKDSIDRRANRFKIGSLLMGYHYQNTFKKLNFNTSGIVNSGVQYNTVEGINAGMNMSLNKEYEDFREWNISGAARYGFANYLWGGSLRWDYLQKPEKFRRLAVVAQSLVQQYNPTAPVSPIVNTAYTLFLNQNYLKLYKKTSVMASFRQELVNGLMFYSNLEYAERDPLQNKSPYLILDDTNKLFTTNDPQHPYTTDSTFTSNNALIVDVTFRIRFKQKYYTLPHRKINTGSKYPNIFVSYKKAIPVLGAKADYDLAMISMEDDIRLGLFGTFAYRLKGGYFLNNKTMSFMDYRHFNGNQTIVANSDYLNSFKLLPYYTYSTNKYYGEVHAEHHFNGFIFNKIPLIKRTKIQEIAGFHALFNDRISNYYEINFGLENIFKVLRIDYVLAYGIGGKVTNGFLFGFSTQF